MSTLMPDADFGIRLMRFPKTASHFGMAKYRILHFSDVHLGLREFRWRYLLDKRLFGRLNQFLRRAEIHRQMGCRSE